MGNSGISRWGYHSSLQSLSIISYLFPYHNSKNTDFSALSPLRGERWRKAAKSWGCTNREKCAIIYTLRRIFCDFFGCFAEQMRLCGDIRAARPHIAQFNTRSPGANAPMLLRRCRAGRTSGRLSFAAHFCARRCLSARFSVHPASVTPCIYPFFDTVKELLWLKNSRSFPLAVSTRSART